MGNPFVYAPYVHWKMGQIRTLHQVSELENPRNADKKTIITSVEPTCHRVINSEKRLLDLWEKGEVCFSKEFIFLSYHSLEK